jgi:lysophospholipase L1-like esterase
MQKTWQHRILTPVITVSSGLLFAVATHAQAASTPLAAQTTPAVSVVPHAARPAAPEDAQEAAQNEAAAKDQPVMLTARQFRRARQALTDWAQLARFREENAKLPPPSAGEERVVFYGDSITDNWGRKYGQFFPGRPYVNRGISGQTTPQMLVRFQQDVVALHPAAVLILAGINDIAGNTGTETMQDIENNFRSMVDIARHEHIRVILASTLPASRLPWRPSVDPGAQVRTLDAWLQTFAHDEGLVFCNYYPALVNDQGGMREDLAVDKAVHPNDAGYALMAPIAEAAIKRSLAQPRP